MGRGPAAAANGGEPVFFRKRSRVEVSSDGAWYVATIVDTDVTSSSSSSSSSTSKKKRKSKRETRYLVEYDASAVAGKPLRREYVDGSSMRPLPPTADDGKDRSFGVNKVVDAFYRGGWRTGVITKISDESNFVVSFQTDEIEFARSDLRIHHEWVDRKWVRPQMEEITEPKAGLSDQKRKRGRPRKVLVESLLGLDEGEEKNGAEAASCEMNVKDCATKETLQRFGHGYPSQLTRRQHDILSKVKVNPVKIDNQLSGTIAKKSGRKLKKLKFSSKRRNQRSETNDKSPTQGISLEKNVIESAVAGDGQDENAMESPATDFTHNDVSQNNKNLLFEKRSSIWENLERMEIFQKMPQLPHFSPLEKCNEASREGIAIGHMVTFANLVDTSKLQFSAPRSKIDRNMEILCELESHGFDVGPIRRRLNELLSNKELEERLLEESKGVQMKILELSLEKGKIGEEMGKIGEEIEETKKKMEELQEKLAVATSMVKMKDDEIDAMQAKMDVIDQDIQVVRNDFGRLAATPL